MTLRHGYYVRQNTRATAGRLVSAGEALWQSHILFQLRIRVSGIMVFLLAFALTLTVAVLVSDLAERSVLSTSVLFLAAGFLLHVLGETELTATDPLLQRVIEVAIFAVLFTDGLRLRESKRANWGLPARALGIGFPLTMAGTGLLAHYVSDLPWLEAWLVGAALSPTDPVLAEAIIGRREVPFTVRHLLNVESGLNDGLAAPFVVLLISAAHPGTAGGHSVIWQILYGTAIGAALPWILVKIARAIPLDASRRYRPLGPFSVGLLLLSLSYITHANIFLTAFAGGVSLGVFGSDDYYDAFRRFGDLLTELLKLGALMLFGALLSVRMFQQLPWTAYLFALLALFCVRPAALAPALAGSKLSRKEWLTVAWFGPKGFSSVIYGLYILQSGIAGGLYASRLVALAIMFSILLHSSTDVTVTRWFEQQKQKLPGEELSQASAPEDESAA